MNEDVERGVRSLANIQPDLLVYACTSGTWRWTEPIQGYGSLPRRLAKPPREDLTWAACLPAPQSPERVGPRGERRMMNGSF